MAMLHGQHGGVAEIMHKLEEDDRQTIIKEMTNLVIMFKMPRVLVDPETMLPVSIESVWTNSMAEVLFNLYEEMLTMKTEEELPK